MFGNQTAADHTCRSPSLSRADVAAEEVRRSIWLRTPVLNLEPSLQAGELRGGDGHPAGGSIAGRKALPGRFEQQHGGGDRDV